MLYRAEIACKQRYRRPPARAELLVWHFGRQIFADAGSTNIWLQYDIYHMQIMEGDLAPTIEKNFARIAHFQLADNPGRHEPGTGEINYPFLFRHLDAIGYRGWVGCEYKPRTTTVDGLGWHAALTLDT